jgi:hypothetical protein
MSYSVIQIKYSLVTAVPTSLAQGELAYSQLSGKLYIGNNTGLPVEIGGADLVARVGSVETAVGLLQTDLAAAQTAITGLTATNATQDTAIAALQASVAALEASQDADLANAIAALQTAIASEANARAAADQDLQDQLDAEIARATAAEATITASVATLSQTVTAAVATLNSDISDLQDTDTQLAGEISALDARLDTIEGAVQVGTSGNVVIQDLTVTGDLVVQGTLTRIDSTVETIEDPVITIGSGTQAVADAMDRGIEYKWFDPNSGTVKTGFFGVDNSDGKFKFIPDATSGGDNIFDGNVGSVLFKDIGADMVSASGYVESYNSADPMKHARMQGNNINLSGPGAGIMAGGDAELVGFVIRGGTF